MAYTKLGLYGDSFAEVWDDQTKTSLKTWPRIIAEKFDVDIVHSGKAGSSYWDIPLQQFSFENCPDILIFCWTSSARLYHKDGIQLHPNPNKSWFGNKKDLNDQQKQKLVNASQEYYKYIHDDSKEIAEYKACLYWFDETVLSKIPSDRKIIHIWSFGHDNTDSKLSGTYHPHNLTYLHRWKNGCEIRPSCMSIALMDGASFDDVDPFENHFNTQEKHDLMASCVMHSMIDTNVNGGYDREALNDYSENVIKKHIYSTMPPFK